MIFLELLPAILFALALTLIIEIIIAFLLEYRKKEEIYLIISVNLLTNPLLNFLIQLNSQLKIIQLSFYLIILIEIGVVVIEFIILSFILKQDRKKLFILSLIMNTASFFVGLILAL